MQCTSDLIWDHVIIKNMSSLMSSQRPSPNRLIRFALRRELPKMQRTNFFIHCSEFVTNKVSSSYTPVFSSSFSLASSSFNTKARQKL